MGRGNYLPIDANNTNWRMVYVERFGNTQEEYDAAVEYVKDHFMEYEVDEDLDGDERENAWEEWRSSSAGQTMIMDEVSDQDSMYYQTLLETIQELLPESFIPESTWHSAGYGREEKTVAHNNLFEVRLAHEDTYNAIIFRVLEDDYFTYHNLANSQIDRVANAFFKRLQKRGFELRVRDGAWMSREYNGYASQPY